MFSNPYIGLSEKGRYLTKLRYLSANSECHWEDRANPKNPGFRKKGLKEKKLSLSIRTCTI